ncbi:MAG: hypothetical protein KJN63_00135 [Acidimicrobiia bacterium]|nr:hypothetical protein [Acidimicrobiia bacterium]
MAMIEADIPIPARRWEFRANGLWVEQVCEDPHMHWSYGLEAFALELDDPTELIRTGYGTRVPMGWELDFVASSPSRWLMIGADPLDVAGAYTQRGELSGLLLDRDGEHQRSSPAQRWHWWGNKPLTSAGIEVAPAGEGREQPEELHLPLSQGPVIIDRTQTRLRIRAADTLAP